MRRAAPALPVSPKLFRHFAVISLAITACIGIFASGEDSKNIVEKVKSRQDNARLKQIESKQRGPSQVGSGGLKIAPGTQLGGWGSDNGPGSSAGSAPQASGGQTALSAPQLPGIDKYPARPAAADIGPGHRKPPNSQQPQQPRRPTQTEIDHMLEASRLRSGGGYADRADPGI